MGSSALGAIGFAFEPTAAPGEQDGFFLPYQAVAASFSAANQPSNSSGMRAHVRVYFNTAVGTVTIAGKDINGNAISETVPPTGSIPVYNNQAATGEQGAFDYVTQNVYGSINASGITTTGITGGFIKVSGIYAARYLLPATAKITPKYGEFSPDEHRALGDLHTHKAQTVKDVDLQLDTALYPDESLWALYAFVNSVTNPSTPPSVPSSPTSLLVATAVSGSPLSLTTQPTAPGMKLILTIAGASITGTITVAGISTLTGEAITEQIAVGTGTNGTYYSANAFQSVNASGITVTGFTSGTLAVSGVYGWSRSALPSLNPFTLTTEWFTGTDSICVPFSAFSEFSLDYDVEKEFKFSAKGIGQDYLPIGNRATNPLNTSRMANLPQPLDTPQVPWAGQVFIDPLSNSPGTTVFGDILSGKITITNPLKAVHKMSNRQTMTTIYRKKWAIAVEAKIDYTNLLQFENWRQDIKQYVQFSFYGQPIGGGNIPTITFIIPFKFNKFEATSTPESDFVQVDLAGFGEYDPGIGASYQISWANSRMAPNYTS
ncbi:MAG TPA: hypothetical protein VNF46_06515 [Gammaproteobacteria bacterium]|nr:hypothetical protein [Gammaproteobacteria bacterium]